MTSTFWVLFPILAVTPVLVRFADSASWGLRQLPERVYTVHTVLSTTALERRVAGMMVNPCELTSLVLLQTEGQRRYSEV